MAVLGSVQIMNSFLDHYSTVGYSAVVVRATVYSQCRTNFCFNFFCNPVLFAICTSTFSKLRKNMYTVACGRVLSSDPL
jgi:hypothetical protein